jgi:hypothetical protein
MRYSYQLDRTRICYLYVKSVIDKWIDPRAFNHLPLPIDLKAFAPNATVDFHAVRFPMNRGRNLPTAIEGAPPLVIVEKQLIPEA